MKKEMARRAVDTTISLIVSVFLVSVLMYFMVYSVANVPISKSKRELSDVDLSADNATAATDGELPLCPRKPEFFSEYHV